jgi:hypothetical protein
MNSFLKDMKVTFRRDPNTGRPRVNKEGSRLDRLQKETGRCRMKVVSVDTKPFRPRPSRLSKNPPEVGEGSFEEVNRLIAAK